MLPQLREIKYIFLPFFLSPHNLILQKRVKTTDDKKIGRFRLYYTLAIFARNKFSSLLIRLKIFTVFDNFNVDRQKISNKNELKAPKAFVLQRRSFFTNISKLSMLEIGI